MIQQDAKASLLSTILSHLSSVWSLRCADPCGSQYTACSGASSSSALRIFSGYVTTLRGWRSTATSNESDGGEREKAEEDSVQIKDNDELLQTLEEFVEHAFHERTAMCEQLSYFFSDKELVDPHQWSELFSEKVMTNLANASLPSGVVQSIRSTPMLLRDLYTISLSLIRDRMLFLHSLLSDLGFRLDEPVPNTNSGETPLIQACASGELDLVLNFIDCGADVSIRDDEGKTALYRAIQHGHIDIVKAMCLNRRIVGLQSSISKGEDTVLMTAASYGQDEIVQLIAPLMSDIDAVNTDGNVGFSFFSLIRTVGEWRVWVISLSLSLLFFSDFYYCVFCFRSCNVFRSSRFFPKPNPVVLFPSLSHTL